ncbi:replication initiator [Actinokineospora sp. NPDC004072]
MTATLNRPGQLVAALPTEDDRLCNLLRSKGFKTWRAKVEAVGGCVKPVRLSGSATWTTEDGTILREVDGTLWTPCGNRRERVCPACSARYAGDTFHLVRAGLSGGKGVPETVSGHVRVFATLTAPSFGAVHNRPTTATGKARPCACGERHHEYDPRLGQPVDPAGYDYTGAVLWQAHAPELWRRFTILCARRLARALGIRSSELREHLRVSYAKVAEYQRRGLVHFHAVIRVDGPRGPVSPPPSAVTADLLCAVVRDAAASVAVDTPDSAAVGIRTLRWGDQVDVAPIATDDPGEPGELARERNVAAYVAKYAVKGTGATAGVDSPIRHEHHIADLDVTAHARTMIATAWRLGGLPEFADLRLRKWAHMLGFRGHFLTKSRHYSVTFGALRAARGHHRMTRELAELGITDTETVTVVNDWTLSGIGYGTTAQRELAEAIGDQVAMRRTRGTYTKGDHS